MRIILSTAVYAVVLVYMTGCAGVKWYAETGLTRIDEQATSNSTVQAQTKPLKCYFVNCSGGESSGS